MIGLEFMGAAGKLVTILVHEKIYVSHTIKNGMIEIFFKSVPPGKSPDKEPTVYQWSFRKAVTDILNWTRCDEWLKTAKPGNYTDISPKKVKKEKPGNDQIQMSF